MRPTTVSKGGLFGAIGWLRDGTKALVQPKDVAKLPASASLIAASSATRSSFSSSFMCCRRFFMMLSSVGRKSVVPGFKD